MKAAVTLSPGNPNTIKIQELPLPSAEIGKVLIRVKAFGLNRSEMFTRQGHSPNVQFPRIQGIECVGIVEEDPSGEFQKGQQVAAIMGGMGRDFDGSYAEYSLVPHSIVFPFISELPWDILGAIPEMFQTVSGSLTQALELKKDESLLIRGGTSSIGLLAGQLAKNMGAKVVSTTRNPDKVEYLKSNGIDYVIIDDGKIETSLRKIFPKGVHKVLELVGTKTLKDSLQCISTKGIVCMTGILGDEWAMKEFAPMDSIPSLGRLTVYTGEASNLETTLLQEFIDAVFSGEIKLNIDKVFNLDQVAEAHAYMESNQAKGKLVVLT
ncbi:MAG: zinc-binding dehydrogenase [Reichenbachiella sp.]